MGTENTSIPEKNAKAKVILAGLVLSVLLVSTFFYIQFTREARRIAPDSLIIFKNLPAGATANIFFKDSKETRQLTMENGIVKLPEDIRERFSLPYNLHATISGFTNGENIDLTWQLDRDGRVYDVLMDGFSPEDTYDFRLGMIMANKNTGFDWSGKVKAHFILLTDIDTNACVDIHRKADAFGFCHIITGKKS